MDLKQFYRIKLQEKGKVEIFEILKFCDSVKSDRYALYVIFVLFCELVMDLKQFYRMKLQEKGKVEIFEILKFCDSVKSHS